MKAELLKRSAQHREQLQKEVELISERTQNVLTNALVIGGTLAAAYVMVRIFTRSSSSKKSKTKTPKIVLPAAVDRDRYAEVEEEHSSPGIMSQIGTALASQATVFLLSIAKEKLAEYLSGPTEKKAETNEHP